MRWYTDENIHAELEEVQREKDAALYTAKQEEVNRMAHTREELEAVGLASPNEFLSDEAHSMMKSDKPLGISPTAIAHAEQARHRITQAEREEQQDKEEALRDELSSDEQTYGVAFVNEDGERVDPNKVFKSVADTYTDIAGKPVRLWKSETEVIIHDS